MRAIPQDMGHCFSVATNAPVIVLEAKGLCVGGQPAMPRAHLMLDSDFKEKDG